jgi:cytochrome c2
MEADAKLLNSIVDSILIESEDQSGELAQASPSTGRETFTNCVACYTLVTHEECA